MNQRILNRANCLINRFTIEGDYRALEERFKADFTAIDEALAAGKQ